MVCLAEGIYYHVSYLRFHWGALKLALEWVFLWGRGRVNYLFLAVIKKKSLCPSNAFPF